MTTLVLIGLILLIARGLTRTGRAAQRVGGRAADALGKRIAPTIIIHTTPPPRAASRFSGNLERMIAEKQPSDG